MHKGRACVKLPCTVYRVQSLGFRVKGLEFGVRVYKVLGFKVSGRFLRGWADKKGHDVMGRSLGFRVYGLHRGLNSWKC